MATEKHDSTHADLAALKQHVGILTQAVMGLLSHIAQASQRPQPGPGGPPQGQPNPALLQRIAAMAAAKRAQQMGGMPGGPPPGAGGPPGMPPGGPPPGMRPPGMAIGGLQMGLNRLEPMGGFNRGIAHSMTLPHVSPGAMRPHMPHFAMGGMPSPMGQPMPMGAGMGMPQPMARPMPMGAQPMMNPAMGGSSLAGNPMTARPF
jgi:hypothetical protein